MSIILRSMLAAALVHSGNALCLAEITVEATYPNILNVTAPPETYQLYVEYQSTERIAVLSLGDDDLVVGDLAAPLEAILVGYVPLGHYVSATYAIHEPEQGWQSLKGDSVPIRVAAGSIRDRAGVMIDAKDIGHIPLYRPPLLATYHGPTTIPPDATSFSFRFRYSAENGETIDTSALDDIHLEPTDTPFNLTRVTDSLGNSSYVNLGNGFLSRTSLGEPTVSPAYVIGVDWLGNPVVDPNKIPQSIAAEVVSITHLENAPQTVDVDYQLTRPGDFWPVDHAGNLSWWAGQMQTPRIRPSDRITARASEDLPSIDPGAPWTDVVVIYESALTPIDVHTLDNHDVYYILELPHDPGAFAHFLEKVSQSVIQNGHEVHVTYRMHRPKHGWPGGTGPRYLHMNPKAVSDQLGVGNGPQEIGPVVTWGFNPGISARLLAINPPTEDSSVMRLRVEYNAKSEIQLGSIDKDHLLLRPLDLFSHQIPVTGERELVYPRGWIPSGDDEMVWRPEALECPIQVFSESVGRIDAVDAQGQPFWRTDLESIVLGFEPLQLPPGPFPAPPALPFEIRNGEIFGPRYYPASNEEAVQVPRMLEPSLANDGRRLTVSYEFRRPARGWPPQFQIATSAGLMKDAMGFHLEPNNLFHQFDFGTHGPAITGVFVSGNLIADATTETHRFQIRYQSAEAPISEASLERAQKENSSVFVGSSRAANTPWGTLTNAGKVHPGLTEAHLVEWALESAGQAALVTYEIERPATGWDSWAEAALPVIISHSALETSRGESTIYEEVAQIRLGFGLEPKPHQVAFEDWLDEFEAQLGLAPSDSLRADTDTDNDGATNAEEFIMGTDPLDAGDSATLEVNLARVDGKRQLEVGFPLRRDFFGVRPELQGSYDGVDWFNADADFELLDTVLLREGIHFITLRTRHPISSAQGFFIRLGITFTN